MRRFFFLACWVLAADVRAADALAPEVIDAAVARAAALGLHDSRYWHLLLHYVPAGAGVESEADGLGFFLAREGKTQPRAELEADVRAFLGPKSGPADGYPECRFPARFAWLAAQLDFAGLGIQPPSCPEYSRWLATMRPGSATLVFASAHINAPASMFGHTLLRINRRDLPDKVLLSNIVNYAGVPTTENPVLYTLLGLTGGFIGVFQAMPYYVKVQEYANFDKRDLWEYDLALTDEELERLVRHIFEMDQTHFDYFYLTENCSYHLLSLLEVARPSLRLRDEFPATVVPVDTLRVVLAQPGLVSRRVFRASHTAVMQKRYDGLEGPEADLAVALAEAETADFAALQQLDEARRRLVLEAAFDYLKYRQGFTLEVETPDQEWARKRELAILGERSKLGGKTAPPPVREPAPPEAGHLSGRVAFGGGVNGAGRPFSFVALRTSLHDLLDSQVGYNQDSQIKLSEFKLRFTPRLLEQPGREADALLIDRIDIADVMSVQPTQGFVSEPSWRVSFGGGRVRDLGCQSWSCMAVDLSGGPGFAVGGGDAVHAAAYGFLDGRVSAGPAFLPNYRLGAGPALGLLFGLGDVLRLHAEGRLRYDLLGDTRAGRLVPSLDVGGALNFGTLALRGTYSYERGYRETAASLLAYY